MTVMGEPAVWVAVSSGGRLAALVSDSGLAVYRIEGGRLADLESWSVPGSFTHADFSAGETRLVTRGDDRTVRVWDANTGAERVRVPYDGFVETTPNGELEPIGPPALSPDGRLLAVSTRNPADTIDPLFPAAGPLRVYVAEGLGPVLALPPRELGEPLDMAFAGDTLFATSYRYGGFALGDPRTGREWIRDSTRVTTVVGPGTVVLSADGGIVGHSMQDQARIRNRRTGRETVVQHPGGAEPYIAELAIDPSGRYLASVGGDTLARIWSVPDGGTVTSLPHRSPGEAPLRRVLFSGDGRWLATAIGGTAALWSVPGWKRTAVFGPAGDLALSWDARFIATVALDSVWLWRRNDRTPVLASAFAGEASAVDVSADGMRLAVASNPIGDTRKGVVMVWSVPGRRHAELSHPCGVTDVAFSPDGKMLATTCADGFLRVWRLSDHREVTRIRSLYKATQVSFSPGGRYVATPGEAHAWRPKDLLDEASRRMTRELDPEERRRFLGDAAPAVRENQPADTSTGSRR
jgi:WD40 repeat protein